MSAMHEVIQTPETSLDRIELVGGDLRLEISRIGAEMVSLQRRSPDGVWHRFLYRDGQTAPPAQGWANHATVMGYFIHRLWEEKSLYRGKPIRGGTHGFVRHFHFAPPDFDPDKCSLTYRVPSAGIPAGAYPLKVRMDLTYRIQPDGGVEVEFAFTNEEEIGAHASFGLHPGFAVENVHAAEVLLPPGRYTRHFAPDNFLDGRTEEFDHPGGPMPLQKSELPGSFLLGLSGVPRRVFELHDPCSGRRVRLDYGDCPFLTIWSDLGPFICMEPCWGLPDCHPPTAFEDKPGIQLIDPGTTLKKTLRLLPVWQNTNL